LAKSPRYTRKPETIGGIKISDRDIEIIKLAYEYRFLNSRQIQGLIKGSDQVILRRLQKLFHHGYLDRPVSQIVFSNPLMGYQNMVYGLGDKGADLLADKLGIDRGNILWKEKNKEAGERYIQHTLMISDFRACLTMALEDIPDTEIIFWKRENTEELREKHQVVVIEVGRQRKLAVVPDGFFCIEESGDCMYFFVEADRSTMTNDRFQNKMKGYYFWWRQGGPKKVFDMDIESFRVLTLTRSKARTENLIQTARNITEIKDSIMFWFACEEDYQLDNPSSVLGDIWRIPRDRRLYGILERESKS